MLLSMGCLHCLPLREGLLNFFKPTEASEVAKATEEPFLGQTLPWLSSSALLQCLGMHWSWNLLSKACKN